MANVNYQHFSTKYNSAYNEFSDSEIAVNDSHSRYKTHLNAVFSEIQYQSPYTKLGMFSASAFESYKHSKYIDAVSPFYQTANTLGGAAQWFGAKGNFSWYLSLGVKWLHTASTNLSKSNNLCLPEPIINLSWRPSDSVRFSADYSYTGQIPSIAQLSESNQWIDTKLVYHGNSTLKPYSKRPLIRLA